MPPRTLLLSAALFGSLASPLSARAAAEPPPVNHAPSAAALALVTDEDTAVDGQLVATDEDGDALRFTLVAPPKRGTATVDKATGALRYQPAPDKNGADAFTVAVSDGKLRALAVVSVTVTPQNDAPRAQALRLTGAEDAPIKGVIRGVDPDGDTLSYAIEASPTHGSATIDAQTGALSFSPHDNWFGQDALSVAVKDASATAVVQVTVDVTPQNDAPTTSALAIDGDEDTAIRATASAADVEGDALTWSVAAPARLGTVTLDDKTSGAFTYTPARDRHGADAFTLAVSDGKLLARAQVTVTVRPRNDAPILEPLALRTSEDTAVRATLRARDVDGDVLRFVVTTPPARGTATLDERSGALVFTPEPNAHGDEQLVVTVLDGPAGDAPAGDAAASTGASATINITVTPQNDAPLPSPASAETREDEAVALTLQATDVDQDALRFSIARPPAHGTVTIEDAARGEVRYQPAANHHGTDSFAFDVSDAKTTTRGEVSLVITPVQDAPVAKPLVLTTAEDTPVKGRVSATDVDKDPLRFELADAPARGTATVDAASGALLYVPNADENGADRFSVKVSDGSASVTAEVSVTILPVNDMPSASAAAFSLDEDAPLEGTLSATDKDGDALTFALARPPKRGKVTVTPDGRFAFTPAPNAHGAESFSVDVKDAAARATAEVTLSITPRNDAPTLRAASLTTTEDAPARATLSATDVDNDALTFSIAEPARNGEASIDARSGALLYQPARDFSGADSIGVRVSDGTSDATATVSVDVRPAQDAPVVRAESARTDEDTAAELVLPASDPDGDALVFRLTTPPTRGTATLVDARAGRVRYVPAPDASGADAIGFEASDGKLKAAGVLTLDVRPVNDAPTAQAASLRVVEDSAASVAVPMADKDGDPLTLEIAQPPARGRAVVEDAARGRVRYEPARDQTGEAVFQVVVSDGATRSAPVEVRVTVEPQNDAPVAKSGALSTKEDVAVSGRLEASDVDGDTLTYAIDAQPPLGTVTVTNAATGAVTFSPAPNKSGEGVVSFTVSDGTAKTTSFLRLKVTAVDDRPVAIASTLRAPRVGRVQNTLAGYDPDGSPVRFEIVERPTVGTLELLDDRTGAFLFVTDGSVTGAVRFSFIVKDGALTSAPAFVTIEIR